MYTNDYESNKADGKLILETLTTVCNAYKSAGHTTEAIFNALSALSTEYFMILEQEEEGEDNE
jgi:hypothetical protein